MDWNKLLSNKRERQSERGENSEVFNYKDIRNDFESDLGRVIFSPALRRMHDKTQVFPLNTDDSVHTRLTHSLETMSVAKGFGIKICDDEKLRKKFVYNDYELFRTIPTLLSTAALVHDIGNPPFGHFGEEAIQLYFKQYFKSQKSLVISENEKADFTHYNGNAQGLRILSKTQVLQDTYGLNLTHAVYSILLKYPNTSDTVSKKENDGYKNNLGVFQSEKTLLKSVLQTTGLDHIRNPFTFFLEAADDICYRIMDIEDGIRKKYYDLEDVFDVIENNTNSEVQDFWIKVKERMDKIDKKNEREKLDSVNIEMKKMADFRTFAINHLTEIAFNNFKENINEIENGEFIGNILVSSNKCLIKTLGKFEKDNIFPTREIHSMELTGLKVIQGLLDHFVGPLLAYKKEPTGDKKSEEYLKWKDNKAVADRLLTIISKSFKNLSYFENDKKNFNELDDYWKLRMIVDYISGMTDQFALKLYQKLQGISLG